MSDVSDVISRSVQCGFARQISHSQMAVDIFHHHYARIDHRSHGERKLQASLTHRQPVLHVSQFAQDDLIGIPGVGLHRTVRFYKLGHSLVPTAKAKI